MTPSAPPVTAIADKTAASLALAAFRSGEGMGP
jgi:hypothetical protein